MGDVDGNWRKEGNMGNIQAAAVRMMRRAQWFFISLPIARRKGNGGTTVIEGRVWVRALSVGAGRKEWTAVRIVSNWGAMLLRTWTCFAVRVEWDSWAVGCERQRGGRQKDGYLNRSASCQRGGNDHSSPSHPLLSSSAWRKFMPAISALIRRSRSSTILYRNRVHSSG